MKRTESFTFRFIQIAIVFGVLLYDFIGLSLGFTYIDEILLVVLIVYACAVAGFTKEFKVFLCIFAMYVLYSALFGVASLLVPLVRSEAFLVLTIFLHELIFLIAAPISLIIEG